MGARVEPSAVSARRVRAPTHELALVCESASDPVDSTSITFGSRSIGATAAFLRFDPVWTRLRRIDAAFVVLEPLTGTASTLESVDVDAWRVLESWTRSELAWTHQPDLGPPHSRAVAQGGPPVPLRIDVTEWARYVHAHPRSDHGIAIEAPAGAGPGSSFSTGLGGGAAPLLEVYGE